MKPQLLALLTAAAWGIGGYFEKKGLHLGNLSPQMGITIRTAVALLILGIDQLPAVENGASRRAESADDDDPGRWGGGGFGGYAVLLRRHQGRTADAGDADCVHLAAVRGIDGGDPWG